MDTTTLHSSFRDPSGFLFRREGTIYRQVNEIYREHFDELMESGLYNSLIEKGWLIPHEEVTSKSPEGVQSKCYKILLPEQIPYISYPYEWCFSQLKDAAILTLNIQLEALQYGMILKDATAYNVQFHKGRPVFIDTLSFESYQEGEPWVAYRQYCQHFLSPLALIVQCDFRLLHLLRRYIDGIPLDLASKLLPLKSWFSYSMLAHIHLHARAQRQFEDSGRISQSTKRVSINKRNLTGLISSLLSAIENQNWKHANTEWGDYYSDTNYIDKSMLHKEELVKKMLPKVDQKEGKVAADFGANTGKFSRLATEAGYYVLSHDIDEVAVDKNYRKMVSAGEESILPLLLDLTNPSPGLGWGNREREPLIGRRKADVGMALALIHHIAISNNVPLESIASVFSLICESLIIEFVPKEDSQVKRLLTTRQDIFPEYNLAGFEAAFSQFFEIIDKVPIQDTERTLFFLKQRKKSD